MKKLIRNEKGFTLIDTLATLAVFSLIIIILFQLYYQANRYDIGSKELNYSYTLISPFVEQHRSQVIDREKAFQIINSESFQENHNLSSQSIEGGAFEKTQVFCRSTPHLVQFSKDEDRIPNRVLSLHQATHLMFEINCEVNGIVLKTNKNFKVIKFIHT